MKQEELKFTITFKELMDTQWKLQKSMGFPGCTDTNKSLLKYGGDVHSEQGAKEMLLAAMVECTEALNEFSWKPWKPMLYKKTDKLKLTTELTDIIQFVANAALYMGITSEDMSEALRVKWGVNNQRVLDGETTSE